jgi:hypothetical protein
MHRIRDWIKAGTARFWTPSGGCVRVVYAASGGATCVVCERALDGEHRFSRQRRPQGHGAVCLECDPPLTALTTD